MTEEMTMIFSEFLGTAILILLGCGVNAATSLNKSKAQGSGWLVVAFGWATAVTIAAFCSGFMGPAHLNPAVTIAMAINGDIPYEIVLPFITAQVAGAVLGSVIVWLAYLMQFDATKDKAAILGTFATSPEVRNYKANIITEIIGTFVLVMALLGFAQTDFAPGVNIFAVGFLILAIGVSLGGPTGYAINPARDLGPRIAHQILPIKNKGTSDWKYSWVPILGPIIGAVLAISIFTVLPI